VPASQVFVNNVQLSDEEVTALESRYGVRVQDGACWYDGMTGAWGGNQGCDFGIDLSPNEKEVLVEFLTTL
jgi:hypothetical protein